MTPRLSHLRNFGVLAHVDAGKTTVSERMLFLSGRIHRIGEVHHGTTTLDHERRREEARHHHQRPRASSPGHPAGDGRHARCRSSTRPGTSTSPSRSSGRCACSTARWWCSTRPRAWSHRPRACGARPTGHGVARVVFVNKMDVVGASFQRCLDELRERLDVEPAAVQLPMGAERELSGVIDLLTLEACTFAGGEVRRGPVPAAFAGAAAEAREALAESLAACDDEVLRVLVESGAEQVSAALLERALRTATLSRQRVPVLCGAALRDTGIQPLLDAVVSYLPSPLEVPAAIGHHPGTNELVTCRTDGPATALVFKCASPTSTWAPCAGCACTAEPCGPARC